MIEFSIIHCKLADVAVIHGVLTLLTGLLLAAMRIRRIGKHISNVRTLHIILGLLTSFYAAILYFSMVS
ncbi:MAG: hypothetical protein QXY40_02835 [Candidatus Methanomethylicia archaeon]